MIANNNVSRIFGVSDCLLTGKKLNDVFDVDNINKIRHGLEDGRPFGLAPRKPLITKDTIYTREGLQLVYGKAVSGGNDGENKFSR